MNPHIRVEHLYKVFGPRPQRALQAAHDGADRAEIQQRFGNVLAVDDVSFEVGRGELFVVMGLSGSGKSTVVRMLNHLIEPTAGSVEIDGQRVEDLEPAGLRRLRAQKMSMVFQHFALFPHRTVGQNAAYGLAVQGVDEPERSRRAGQALETVGLSGWADRYADELSGGMQQRVGLARALATDADVLLMDEPFSALDPLIRRDMQDLLVTLQSEMHRTIVFITHDLNEAMRLGDRICVLKDGRVVQIGTGPEIIGDPANDYVAEFVADVDRSRVLTADLAMREPRRSFTPDAGPREVLDWLDEQEFNGVYVLGDDRRVLGVARDDRLARGIREGAAAIGDLLTQDYARASADTLLSDLAGLAAQHTVPIAVLDDNGRLLGVVPRARLLAALAGEEAHVDA
ncbi:MAG: glycine betaine/L-proline ABC transporter ATP-binding protein [Actinobacteria bacterium]|jgi:glycine betaine/proline transport system ATP-binding protein|nr:glycine betaine/L-proline ABC transporter ATP-binding protein [Actinomycetota bacterium]